MSLIDRLRAAARGTSTAPGHPDVPRTPGTDAVQVRSPATGDAWRVGQDVCVTWRLAGATGHLCDIVLVRGDGDGIEGIADLAVGVDPKDLSAWVTVPDVPPGDDYAVALTSSEPMTAYSGRLTIVR